MIAEIGEPKSRAELPSAAAQSPPGDSRINSRTNERRKLAWLLRNRTEYGEDIRRAVPAQPYHRSWRKVPVGCIDDRTTGRKWNSVRGGNPGRNVGFRVDGHRACPRM